MTEIRYGSKDGSQKGQKKGGRGRNQTAYCRHPTIAIKRKR